MPIGKKVNKYDIFRRAASGASDRRRRSALIEGREEGYLGACRGRVRPRADFVHVFPFSCIQMDDNDSFM